MALTQITADSIADGAVTAEKISQTVSLGGGGGPKITAIEVTDSSYTVLDDTAVALDGGYIKITGSGFTSGIQVVVNNIPATSTQFVSSTTVHAQLPAKTAGSYVLYLVNSDGGVAISVTGVTYSEFPTWITGSSLPNTLVDNAFSVQLQAPPASVFTLAADSILPPGTTLSSSGLLSGTVTGLSSNTTYTFTVTATDSENQDSPRTFSLPISVAVVGQVAFTTEGTYSWTAPTGVTSVCAVVIAGGSSGNGKSSGGGGGLAWRNNIPVTPGQSYTVVVGKGGYRAPNAVNEVSGDYSLFTGNNSIIALAYGGSGINGGSYNGQGGGNGGTGATWTTGKYSGGGGAGGYAGSGGAGGSNSSLDGTSGSGGGGGGGAAGYGGGGGGGTGLFGQGASGAGGIAAATGWPSTAAGGGSDGSNGNTVIAGGNYGGGSGAAGLDSWSQGGDGAVRIIWGPDRAFPSTNTADL